MKPSAPIGLGTAIEHALKSSNRVHAFGASDGPSRHVGTHQSSSPLRRCIDEAEVLREIADDEAGTLDALDREYYINRESTGRRVLDPDEDSALIEDILGEMDEAGATNTRDIERNQIGLQSEVADMGQREERLSAPREAAAQKARGNLDGARAIMTGFIRFVTARSGRAITTDAAQDLIKLAQAIIDQELSA